MPNDMPKNQPPKAKKPQKTAKKGPLQPTIVYPKAKQAPVYEPTGKREDIYRRTLKAREREAGV